MQRNSQKEEMIMSNLSSVDQTTNLHRNNELQLLCFRLEKDKDLYAVNVFKIREVVKYRGDVTVISHEGNSLVEGLITIRELTIPLIDLKKWFYYDANNEFKNLENYGVKREEGEDEVVMICEFSRWTVGVRIYEADRILNKKWTEIKQSSDTGLNTKLVSRTRYFDGSLVQVVDIERMLVDVFPWVEDEKNDQINRVKQIVSDKEVLLADDSLAVVKTMENILNKLGVNYKTFSNGQKLLDYIFGGADISNIGIVITDLEMPEASGFEVMKQMKGDSRTSHIPIVVNSSMSGSSNEDMARSLNADEFISKSDPIQVEDALRRLMVK